MVEKEFARAAALFEEVVAARAPFEVRARALDSALFNLMKARQPERHGALISRVKDTDPYLLTYLHHEASRQLAARQYDEFWRTAAVLPQHHAEMMGP